MAHLSPVSLSQQDLMTAVMQWLVSLVLCVALTHALIARPKTVTSSCLATLRGGPGRLSSSSFAMRGRPGRLSSFSFARGTALPAGGDNDDGTLRYFDNIEDLQQWESATADTRQRSEPLARDFPALPRRRRVIHCHDYAGGYTQSADEDYLATFSSWALFDVFIYFSHHRVVVPPRIWIEKAHQEHKMVLGTFLFEGRWDSSQAQAFLGSEETWQKCADRLVDLCVFYGFDGWLMNVEASLGESRGAFVSFLSYVRLSMKERIGGHAQVIYYDAHNEDGVFKHQDALLHSNKAYFEACDGIFINYRWFDYDTVARSKMVAGDRQFDVYAGVDVWARNCEYNEGPGCKKAVDRATSGGVSVAMFAPGWVQEKGPGIKELPGSEAARRLDDVFWSEILL